jgi:MOSC domain-containing protein YiiM
MEELSEAWIVENAGIEGCAHARPGGKRQVLLVDLESLRALDLGPGMIRENITTEGLDVNALQVGQRLRVGEAELEVSLVCEPCALMEKIRRGLMAELQGRRGMLCRVVRGGVVRGDDEIEVLQVAQRSALARG